MTMREIILDTETTGLDPTKGDKIVEIGCVELFNHVPTGKTYHVYINPERSVPPEAIKVHGLTDEFLSDKKPFLSHAKDFLNFIDNAPLVIHNAEFDLKFLNWELKLIKKPIIDKNRTIDTLLIARKKFPGSPASLDALCRRYKIDNSGRKIHGALRDAELLAQVYLELIGGLEPSFSLTQNKINITNETIIRKKVKRNSRSFPLTEEEKNNHKIFLESIKNPIWLQN
jgi:DNA polymerase-3 subunit epsilon